MRNQQPPIDSTEAASILGISRSQVNRLAAAGKVAALRKLDGPRGAYIFDRAYIERLAADRKERAA